MIMIAFRVEAEKPACTPVQLHTIIHKKLATLIIISYIKHINYEI